MSLKPPPRDMNFERLKPEDIDSWLTGTIEKVEYNEAHEFKGQHAKIAPAVRFIIRIEGYEYPKSSRWMVFSYGSKSNLWLKWLSKLVEGGHPDMDFDLTALDGKRIKVMYEEQKNGDKIWQSVSQVRPLDKISYDGPVAEQEQGEEPF